MHRALTIALLLAFATLAVYAQVVHFDFVHIDDPEYVIGNPHLDEQLDTDDVRWAFGSFYFSNWHPLTWLSYQADAALFGRLDAGAYHAVNLFWHLVATLLCFAAMRALSGRDIESGLVAAVFAIHPLHVESVAWISERKDVLAGAAWWGTCWAWARYVRGPRPRIAWGLALLVFALGLMAKPLLVTLPFALLLLDHWPLQRAWSRALVYEKLPFFALAAASSLVTYLAQQHSGAVIGIDEVPLVERIANAVVGYARYLALAVWPSGLAVFHPHVGMGGQPPLRPLHVALAALVLVAATAGAVRAARSGQRMWLVGWLWFLGTLVPMIGIVQVGFAAISERYTYIPLVGLAMAVVFGVSERVRARARARRLALALALGALAALGLAAHARVAQWRDSRTLFESTLAATRNNAFIHYNFGHWLQQQGETDAAIHHYRRAFDIDRSRTDAGVNLGALLFLRGERAAGIATLREALRIRPDHAEGNLDLGLALLQAGELRPGERHLRRVLTLDADPPVAARAHAALAAIERARGAIEAAERHASEARRLAREPSRSVPRGRR